MYLFCTTSKKKERKREREQQQTKRTKKKILEVQKSTFSHSRRWPLQHLPGQLLALLGLALLSLPTKIPILLVPCVPPRVAPLVAAPQQTGCQQAIFYSGLSPHRVWVFGSLAALQLMVLGCCSSSGGVCDYRPHWCLAWYYQFTSHQGIIKKPTYQLFVSAEEGKLSKPMNYIKRAFSPLTIPWTTQTSFFILPELIERRHSSLNRGI